VADQYDPYSVSTDVPTSDQILHPEKAPLHPSDIVELKQALDTATDPAAKADLQRYYNRLVGPGDLPLPDANAPQTPLIPKTTTPSLHTTSTRTMSKSYGNLMSPEIVTQYADSAKKAANDILDVITNAGVNVASMNDAILNNSKNKQAEIAAQSAIDQRKGMSNQQFIDFTRASIGDPDGVIVNAQKMKEEALQAMRTLGPKIDAEDQVGWWDDPIRWAVNQFTLPKLKMAYNAASMHEKNADSIIATTTDQVRARQVIDAQPTIDESKALATAQQAVVASQAAAAASANQQDFYKLQAQALQSAAIANAHSFEFQATGARLLAQATATTESDRETSAAQTNLDLLNRQILAIGGVPIPSVKEYQNMKPDDRSFTEKMLREGGGAFGNDLGNTLRFVNMFGGVAAFSKSNPTTYQLIVDQSRSPEYVAEFRRLAQDPKFAAMPAMDQRIATLSSLSQTQANAAIDSKTDFSNPATVTPNSPYKMRFGDLVQYKSLKDNIFIPTITDAIKTAQYKPVEERDIAFAALGKVQAGVPIDQVANDLTQLYTEGSKQQWLQRGAAKAGYPQLQAYRSSADGATNSYGDSSGRPVNWMSLAEVKHWLVVASAKYAAQQQNAKDMFIVD
jgi:hypothetical protein